MDTATIILGTFAITLALTQSEGPYGLFYKLRQNKKVDNFGLLNCFLCTALWVSVILGLCMGRLDLVLISWGGSTLLDRIANK